MAALIISSSDLPEYLKDEVYDDNENAWANATLKVYVDLRDGHWCADLFGGPEAVVGSKNEEEPLLKFFSAETLKRIVSYAFERAHIQQDEFDADAIIREAELKADDRFLEERNHS